MDVCIEQSPDEEEFPAIAMHLVLALVKTSIRKESGSELAYRVEGTLYQALQFLLFLLLLLIFFSYVWWIVKPIKNHFALISHPFRPLRPGRPGFSLDGTRGTRRTEGS